MDYFRFMVGPRKESRGISRLIIENINGVSTNISDNEKLNKAKEIIDELEADLVLHTERKVNCKHKDNRNGFRHIFQCREEEIRAIAGHNVHENVGRYQEGGTSLLLYGSH